MTPEIKQAAVHFIAGRYSEKEAALAAGLPAGSTRAIRRAASALVQRHLGLLYADIVSATPQERARMANRVAQQEGVGGVH